MYYVLVFLIKGKTDGNDGDRTDKVISKVECSDTDRALYNSNLLSKFSKEYDELSDEEKKRIPSGILIFL